MAIFGYGRVSTSQQDTENQRLELEQAGWTFDFWFTDVVSGKVPALQRKAFSEMLSKIRDGETLVVAKLDRLGRDAIDGFSRLSGRWPSVISRSLSTSLAQRISPLLPVNFCCRCCQQLRRWNVTY